MRRLSQIAVKPSEVTKCRRFSEVTKTRCGGILIPRARRLQAQLSSIGTWPEFVPMTTIGCEVSVYPGKEKRGGKERRRRFNLDTTEPKVR